MRTSEQIKIEIEDEFGFVPPFFGPALQTPQVLENLWQQTLSAYVNNPLSPLFKEKLSAYLSRYCAVPYCMICHSCSLRRLGVKAREVLELLESPPPSETDIDYHLRVLAALAPGGLRALPESNSALEESLLYCAIFIGLEREQTEYCRTELHRILGSSIYANLVTFIAYVKMCHVWMEAYPEVAYEADKRAIDHLGVLLEEEPGLADFLGNYIDRVRRERQSRAEQLVQIAERKRAESALRLSEEKFRNLVEQTNDWIWEIDLHGVFTYSSPKASEIVGYKLGEILGKATFDFMPVDEVKRFAEVIGYFISKQEPFTRLEKTLIHKEGHLVVLETSGSPVFDYQGVLQGYRGIARDISERKQAEEAQLRAQIMETAKLELEKEITERKRAEERLAKLNACFLSFGSDPNENINHLTTLCGELLGATCTLYNCLEGGLLCTSSQWNTPADYNPVSKPDGHICYDVIKSGTELLVVSDLQNTDYALKDPNVTRYQLQTYLGHPVKCGGMNMGSVCAVYQTAFIPNDEDRKLISLVAAAIGVEEERKRAESQLVHYAFHDALTGLPNRALLMDRLRHILKRAKRRQDCLFAVIFLDLDRFKVINDSLGHTVGDQLLVTFAQRLSACLRPEDTVARLGGDEFAILLENIQDVSDATHLASRLQQELSLPLNLDGYEVFTTASIGIALSTTDYNQPEDLLRNADTAMYQAKTLGKARYEVFNQDMHAMAVTRLQLENNMRRAVERQEFQLHYQPIVSLKTGSLSGFEALLRWQYPLGSLISPVEFIPVAEETGLIIPIGWWVLREACRQMHVWHLQFPSFKPLTINVNISSRQFAQAGLIEQIDQVLRETGLDACSLKLEITESVIMENTEAATSMLQQLKALGVQLHIDDFGTGYSSLSYLRRFPIDTLKIDRSFVSHMGVGDENSEIVQTIVTLAHNLGMAVTAEGVETAQQLAHLRALKCEFGQGYFFSSPVDGLEAGMLIEDWSLD